MKGRIIVEVEDREDLQQLRNEIEAAAEHSHHMNGDVNIIDMENDIE